MESSTAEARDQLAAANVVHVAVASSSFRVDSTTQLLPASSDVNDASRLPSNTPAASIANCGTDIRGRCPPRNSSVVGLPAVTPDVTAVYYVQTRTNAATPVANHDAARPVSDASPSHDVDDMATFRAALDAVDPSALVGLRRARSKSVLVPVCRPPPADVRFRSRGSVQCDQVTRDDDIQQWHVLPLTYDL